MRTFSEHIVKHGSGYRLLSHKGKNLGTFKSRAAAAKHEGEVEYFKHHSEETVNEGQGHDLAREGQKRNLHAQISAAERSLSSASEGAKQSIRARIDSLHNQLERLQEANKFTTTFTGPSWRKHIPLPEDAIEDTPSMTASASAEKRLAALKDNEPKPGEPQTQQKGKEPFQFSGAVAESKRGYKEYAKHLRPQGKRAAAKIDRQQGKKAVREGDNMSAGMGLQPWMRESYRPSFGGFGEFLRESEHEVTASALGFKPHDGKNQQFQFPESLSYGGRSWRKMASGGEHWTGKNLTGVKYSDAYGNILKVVNESYTMPADPGKWSYRDHVYAILLHATKPMKMGDIRANYREKHNGTGEGIPSGVKQLVDAGEATRKHDAFGDPFYALKSNSTAHGQLEKLQENRQISEGLNALAKSDRVCDNCSNPIPAGDRYELTKDPTKRHLCKGCSQKAARNATSRARYGIMKDLGMKRTRYGWEEFQHIAPLLGEGYYRITVMDGKKEHIIKFQGSATDVRSKVGELRAAGKEIEEVETVGQREYAAEDNVSITQECDLHHMRECPDCMKHMREFDQGMRGISFSEDEKEKCIYCSTRDVDPKHDPYCSAECAIDAENDNALDESKSAKKALNLPRAPMARPQQSFKTRRNELDRKAKHKGKRFDEDSTTAPALPADQMEAADIKLIDVRTLKTKQNTVNNYLADVVGRKYWESIPIDDIFKKLEDNGFKPVQEDGTPWSGFLLGRDGRAHIQLKTGGPDRHLSLSWHKMDVSGRYEVVAYVN